MVPGADLLMYASQNSDPQPQTINDHRKSTFIGTIGITHQPQEEKCSTVNEELENHQNHHCRNTGEKGEQYHFP